MTKYSVGSDVLSYCTKCKLVLAHTIVALKDPETIYKVKCNTCNAVHSYKDPTAATLKKVSHQTLASLSRETKAEKTVHHWQDLMDSNPNEILKYSIRTKFLAGDKIDHPKFGVGIVESLLGRDKVNVVFKSGTVTLIHNK